MKKREFFKRLFGVGVAAIVAPEVLLGEEKKPKAIVGETHVQNSPRLWEPSTISISRDSDGRIIKAYVSDIEFLDEDYDYKNALLNKKKYPRKRKK